MVISGFAKYEGRVDYEANYEFHTFKEDGAPSGQGGVVVISLKIYGAQIWAPSSLHNAQQSKL